MALFFQFFKFILTIETLVNRSMELAIVHSEVFETNSLKIERINVLNPSAIFEMYETNVARTTERISKRMLDLIAETTNDRRGFLRAGREYATGRRRPDGRYPGAHLQHAFDSGCRHLDRRLHGRVRGHERRPSEEGQCTVYTLFISAIEEGQKLELRFIRANHRTFVIRCILSNDLILP